MTRPLARIALISGIAWLTTPQAASGQAAAYMTVLTIPPANVGTCIADECPKAAPAVGTVHLRTSHLVMKTRSPGRDRDMTAVVDEGGGIRGYTELEIRQTGLTTNEGDHVYARFPRAGVIEGEIGSGGVTMPQPDLTSGISLDSALRAMNAHAKHTSRHAALSAADKAKVRALADWLVTRCPPR